MNTLAGKIALVTGGTRGIGRATVELFAAEGATVFFTGTDAVRAASVAAQISAQAQFPPERVTGLPLDVRDVHAVDETVRTILERCGKIDILVNNAGIARDMLAMRMSDEQWNDVIATNLTGVFNCIRAVSRPMLKAHYGRIVNVSSIIAFVGHAGQCNYAAAKAGVLGLTRSLAVEFASRNVTVNAIAPGSVETDMLANVSEAIRTTILERTPMKRIGTPAEIAASILFLASDASSYMTGQVLNVNGGLGLG